MVLAGWIEAPFQNIAVDDYCARKGSVTLSLLHRADIHDQGTTRVFADQVVRLNPVQACPGLGQNVGDRTPLDLIDACGFSTDVREKILWRNAERVLE